LVKLIGQKFNKYSTLYLSVGTEEKEGEKKAGILPRGWVLWVEKKLKEDPKFLEKLPPEVRKYVEGRLRAVQKIRGRKRKRPPVSAQSSAQSSVQSSAQSSAQDPA